MVVRLTFIDREVAAPTQEKIAGVFDHEWGHGLDDNDAVPTIASPSGEGIADVYTALRFNSSCYRTQLRCY